MGMPLGRVRETSPERLDARSDRARAVFAVAATYE
jgi:hypothetical protein